MKGVVYGLIATSLGQALLAAIGFWIAGVPQALLLGFVTFVLSFVPGGPPLVWGSVALWLLLRGPFWWGTFVAAWGLLLVRYGHLTLEERCRLRALMKIGLSVSEIACRTLRLAEAAAMAVLHRVAALKVS